ncbi:C4-dicarboxylate transporter DctA [Bartonella sp. DGB1]|uniref:C4-dicarboxylate transporter DctA n=1 Tax=Bartonella sp. DGB1 TaxID=3239807 RepID=UPI0035254816
MSHHLPTNVPTATKLPIYRQLFFQVLVAIILGVILGHYFPNFATQMKPLGDGFIKLVKMIIAPVIFLTLTIGIAQMSDLKKVRTLAVKSLLYFFFFSTLALILGLIAVHLFKPGVGLNISIETLDNNSISHYVAKAKSQSIVDFLMNIIPTTLLSPLVTGNILQIICLSIFFGIALSSSGEYGASILNFLQKLSMPIFKLVSILMSFAPIGAFGAIAFTIGQYGIASMANLAYLIFVFYFISAFFIIVILGLMCRYIGFSIFSLLKYLKDEIVLILGAGSSEAALPMLMQKMEKAGVKKSIVGLVVPLGYSFNLDGTNIYMTLAAIFIAQALGIDLTWQQQVLLLLVAIVSSKGAAGIAGAGFITLATTLSIIPDIPVAGMAIILGIDKFMNECRTLTNFVGNAVATVVIASWEKGLDLTKFKKTMKSKSHSIN